VSAVAVCGDMGHYASLCLLLLLLPFGAFSKDKAGAA
jgi:hypothetical protein